MQTETAPRETIAPPSLEEIAQAITEVPHAVRVLYASLLDDVQRLAENMARLTEALRALDQLDDLRAEQIGAMDEQHTRLVERIREWTR